MAYSQPEKEYIKRLLQAEPNATNEQIKKMVDKRRAKETEMNAPKEKGILGKALDV